MNQSIVEYQLVDAQMVDSLVLRSASEPRRRAHLLLHAGQDDTVQRLMIAAQPGTYVRPHVHSRQWEMLVLHRGVLDIILFNPDGLVRSRARLDISSPVIQIPLGFWHGCIVSAPDTLVIEIKPGPYHPNEFAVWSPEENHAQANEFVRWASRATEGQVWASGR